MIACWYCRIDSCDLVVEGECIGSVETIERLLGEEPSHVASHHPPEANGPLSRAGSWGWGYTNVQ